ncbi:hypothetical protein SK128_012306, partial [Halocaridina rubra]
TQTHNMEYPEKGNIPVCWKTITLSQHQRASPKGPIMTTKGESSRAATRILPFASIHALSGSGSREKKKNRESSSNSKMDIIAAAAATVC